MTNDITIGRAALHLARFQEHYQFFAMGALRARMASHDRNKRPIQAVVEEAKQWQQAADEGAALLGGAEKFFARVAIATPPANEAFFCVEQ